MKRLLFASFLTVGLSIAATAGDLVPIDHTGQPTLPTYAGVSSCEISNSSSTRAVLCASGSGIVLGIYGSSVAATDQVVFRDSATANNTSTKLLTADLNCLKMNQAFPRFKNGLSATALVAPGSDGTGNHPAWTIIYRALP